eukprot:CAMPEP_0179025796 /NCGR_PEP_ID=MMETSP0796-20121207/8176_1 /TAXON_ID=73915 /ORGANISM="Pyrodinium bahamense, Strain pbaha01" /LENGTH=300 /DNA_ID=CAMNT_0020721841 /DNA_START=111 /DNA_END=1013 /DNA_ORIENTATION=+
MSLIVKLLATFKTFELVFWRSCFMTILSAGICLSRHINPLGPGGHVTYLLLVRGFMGFAFMAALFYAIQVLPLADAIVFEYTSPVITAVAAAALLGERTRKIDILGFTLCLLGVILVAKPSFAVRLLGGEQKPLPCDGVVGGLCAAVFSSVTYLLLRYAKGLFDPMVSTAYFAMVSIVASPVTARLCSETWHRPTGKEWVLLVLLAVFAVLAQNLLTIGLALQTAGKALAMNYTQVVFSYIYQIMLLHQPSDLWSIFGAIMIAAWGAISLLKEWYADNGMWGERGQFLRTPVLEEGGLSR